MTREEAGRAYLSAIHAHRSALSREMDAVQVGNDATGDVLRTMLKLIDARENYIEALARG